MRNDLVTYVERKCGPQENWRIETVGGGLLHHHWFLQHRGNQTPPTPAITALGV